MVGEEEQKIVCNDGDILNAKWDACVDLSLRRVFYTSAAGALSSLVLFRGPASRWAALAFGAGVGIGSAYTESSRILEGSLPNWTSKAAQAPAPKDEQD
ncbi:hypothetical protein MKW94_003951 [Papaver nudicaule]|uniref:Uncharacterized protein n=1 Tax=Papaver nudicaule TaxID=74823 RepID=A0AA41S3X9_PAPNU|nr:hypothetical protein [Papaver nudicaule]